MHPSPLQCRWLWWGSDVPFDAIHLLHRWIWEPARSQSLPGPRSPKRGWGDSRSARPSHSNTAAEAQCLFLPHAMSWVSSIAAGLCKQEVIKSAYSPGGRLINSTFSPCRGGVRHTRAVSIHRLPHSSPLGCLVFSFCFYFFPFFQREDEDCISRTGICTDRALCEGLVYYDLVLLRAVCVLRWGPPSNPIHTRLPLSCGSASSR